LKLIDHPERFKTGTRVLLLKARHKDGAITERQLFRVTHTADQFDRALREFADCSKPNERIYGAAGARDLKKAARLFKERQLAAEYDADPMAFYRSLEDRWLSALMSPRSQEQKLWLFDCDSPEDEQAASRELQTHYDKPTAPYRYASKSGTHVIVEPFDTSRLSQAVRKLVHENALMLWGWS
jgi:hypothetical protein